MKRAAALAAVCACVVSCGGVDRQKFDRVYTAGSALQVEVQSSRGEPHSKSRERLKELDTEIAALQDRVIGIHEVDALHAYSQAADAYRYFLRFKTLDLDADRSEIVVKGPDLEVATRFKLPVETRSGSKRVNRAQAITVLLQAGEQHLSDGNRLAGR